MKCTWCEIAVLGAVLFALTACGGDDQSPDGLDGNDEEDAGIPDADDECEELEHDVPWSYDGDDGPDEWAELDEDFALCEAGMEQSPINLSVDQADADGGLGPLQTNWQASEMVGLWNNGHTWQVNMKDGSSLAVAGSDDPYRLRQFHFHAPSEHTLNGKSYPMEVHFVHLPANPDADHSYAVIGVFFEVGDANPTLEKLWADLSVCPHEEAVAAPALQVDPVEFLPDDGDYFKYQGSLTTPACLEGVHWHVFAAPITASQQQIDKFREVFGQNQRPVQELNAREVLLFRD
jgi:carbonic anhydrase